MMRASRIPTRARTSLFKSFVNDIEAKKAADMAGVSRMCANRYYRHYRECIYQSLVRAPRFSGEVEVDIGYFAGRAPKKDAALVRRLAGLPTAQIVGFRAQVAKDEKKKILVLGFLARGGDVYLHPIKRKDRITLESVVRLVVEGGSTIYTDFEKGFNKLKLDGYHHESINHSLHYSAGNGKHLNGIESFFHETRRNMGGKFRGVARSTILLHIKEREFRYNHKTDLAKALKALL